VLPQYESFKIVMLFKGMQWQRHIKLINILNDVRENFNFRWQTCVYEN